ncbi:uncharacterized protein NPIL_679381 [Nephila pilipes]|uniref:Uncharacterized protein n=1 Tax=Nephila pilipes TaxID=299642 RepID=A0A8X6NMG1_NEPPI|nr:uncharacterized protein NPIL_679381 [Nephila pilipes]
MLSSCIPIAVVQGRNIAPPLKHIWGERNGARFTSSWIWRGLDAWQAITHRPDKETLGPHFNDPPFFDLSHFPPSLSLFLREKQKPSKVRSYSFSLPLARVL